MIIFKEGQNKIYIGKNKIEKNPFDNDQINYHIVYPEDLSTGYTGKFIRVITLENKYNFEVIKDIKTGNNYEEVFNEIVYFENGGYSYDKKNF